MRLALNLHVGRYPGRFLRQNIGRPPPGRMVLKASWVLTWNFWPPRHPAGGRGAETYVAPPSAGRRPAVRPPQVLPPAGPSHLTPSRPGEAKSRSDEAPTNSDWFQWLCPGVPLQIEVKGHLNAYIMAWYCMGVDMGVK